jgi:hypothetical protein
MKLIAAIAISVCVLAAADNKLGKPLTLKEPIPVSKLLAKPGDYVGKTVQVKGKIAEVCQMAGCWIELAGDDGKTVRIKVNDGEIEFPKDGAGRLAIAEGLLSRIDMTREEAIAAAKHQAEESGKPFKEASVQGPVTKYQIQGTGAIILSN